MLSLKNQKKSFEGNVLAFADAISLSPKNDPFDDVPQTSAGHFDLYFLAAAAQISRRLMPVFGTRDAVFAEFPFLQIYDERLAGREPDELADEKAFEWWKTNLLAW